MLKEFKEFAFKGNLIDMAVGIIIGGAFATVVKSLVDNVFMPVLGSLTGGVNFADMYVNLGEGGNSMAFAEAKEKGLPVIGYGQFIQDAISFVILALVVFIVIKKVAASLQKEEEEPEEEAPKQEVLLEEIRDLLKKS